MPVSAVVLLHSPLVGPGTWTGVATELHAAGYTTLVPDLRGAHDVRCLAAAVARELPAGVDEIVLIGHSGVGPLMPAIAERLRGVVSLVYVDAGLPRPGVSWVDAAPAELVAHLRSTVDANGLVPPWHEWWPAGTIEEILPDEAQRAAFIAEVPRLPWSFFSEPFPVPQWTGVSSYLLLSEGYDAEADWMRAVGHPVVELALDHLAPLTRPAEVAAGLRELLDAPRTGLAFGPHARTYDQVRPEYPTELVDKTLAYARNPVSAVEVGAGTGKASEAVAQRVARLTCIEPDPGMAALLRERFAHRPHVTVVEEVFEEWAPPAVGTDLLYFALSWHWIDPTRRCDLAYAALRPGGTLAIFGHQYGFADPAIEQRISAVYERLAPQLRTAVREHYGLDAVAQRTAELTGSGHFVDVRSARVVRDQPYPTARYIRLLRTFSPHIALARARRRALHEAIAGVIDDGGGVLTVRLDTTLVLARGQSECRATDPPSPC
jgi:SAM-dependent methyltransferase